jgi:hypothetical protein
LTGPDDVHPQLGLRFNTEHAEAHYGLFLARALERWLSELRTESWATAASLDVDGVIFRHTHEGHDAIVFEHGPTLVSATLAPGHCGATVAGASQEEVAATLAALHERLPAPDPSSGSSSSGTASRAPVRRSRSGRWRGNGATGANSTTSSIPIRSSASTRIT